MASRENRKGTKVFISKNAFYFGQYLSRVLIAGRKMTLASWVHIVSVQLAWSISLPGFCV